MKRLDRLDVLVILAALSRHRAANAKTGNIKKHCVNAMSMHDNIDYAVPEASSTKHMACT